MDSTVVMNLSSLNPPQREAVVHRGTPLLVLAGAGSGKTRVITFRIAHLLEGGVDPKHVAALTFTNKAAAEMRERVAGLVRDKKRASAITMGTFHSLGLRILKEDRKALGYPSGFIIYDTADQMGVIREQLRRIKIEDRRFDVRAILSRISLAKNAFVAPEDFEPTDGDEYDEITAEVYPRYEQALRAFAAVDFDDLITSTVRLLETNTSVREKWASKFRHVLVDEYQDTNRAQLLLVRALVENHGNLCVVGDDDQSIYSWRGANPANILEFEKSFPGAREVKLEQNYRSSSAILDAANAVILNNKDRRGKQLWSEKPAGEKITVGIAPGVEAESRFVATEIERLRSEQGRSYSEFAVLYRSNIQTPPVEEALRELRIPYGLVGGQQFYERKEVKDLIAYLRVALNPRDEIALRRVINYPARGIGATTVAKLAAFSQSSRISMWKSLPTCPDIGPRPRKGLQDFAIVVERVKTAIDGGQIADVLAQLIEDTALFDDIRAGSPNLTAAQRRIDNVSALIRSLERHEQRSPGKQALTEYLRRLSLSDQEDEKEPAGDRVTLTTLHGAKGLEFPVVFLIGAEENLLPHHRTLMPTATDVGDSEHTSDVSEERRLAYVGITRAEEQLIVTLCATRMLRGKPSPRTPSRFLLEIPPELIEERDIAAEARAPVSEDELQAFFSGLSFGD